VHAREAVRQDPAAQVSLELLAHEAGQSEAGRAALLGLDQERGEVLAHGRVQDGHLRLAAAIGGRERRAGGAGVALVGLRGRCLLALGHAAWPFHEAGHEQ
jgi:hypothetical protein